MATGSAVAQTNDGAPSRAFDTRREERIGTLARGKLAFGNGAAAVDCDIVNISKHGARVRARDSADIPKVLFLVHLGDKMAHQACVVWRRDSEIGLEFVRAYDFRVSAASAARAFKRHVANYLESASC